MNGKRLIGLYPGTFDPVTLGHLDIIKRAVKLVDHLVIGVANNTPKNPAFTLEERVAMVKSEAEKAAAGHATLEVRAFDSLLVKFAAEVGASLVANDRRFLLEEAEKLLAYFEGCPDVQVANRQVEIL